MGGFRHIPAQFDWSEGGMTVVQPKAMKTRPPKKKPVVAATVSTSDDFDSRVDLATLKVESALNSFLDVLDNKVDSSFLSKVCVDEV